MTRVRFRSQIARWLWHGEACLPWLAQRDLLRDAVSHAPERGLSCAILRGRRYLGLPYARLVPAPKRRVARRHRPEEWARPCKR